jgi:hypothetical protein
MITNFLNRVCTVLLLASAVTGYAQDCADYHLLGDCSMDRQKDYQIFSQSKSVLMSPLDSVDFNIVFYREKDYILSFCTHKKLYPIHFKLIDPDTREVCYDNQSDNYIESVGLGFDVTRNLIVRIEVLARKATYLEIEEYVGCVGLLIQYRNYPEKT